MDAQTSCAGSSSMRTSSKRMLRSEWRVLSANSEIKKKGSTAKKKEVTKRHLPKDALSVPIASLDDGKSASSLLEAREQLF